MGPSLRLRLWQHPKLNLSGSLARQLLPSPGSAWLPTSCRTRLRGCQPPRCLPSRRGPARRGSGQHYQAPLTGWRESPTAPARQRPLGSPAPQQQGQANRMGTLCQAKGRPALLLSSCQALPPGRTRAARQESGDAVLGSSRSRAQWRGASAAGAAALTVTAFVRGAATGGTGLPAQEVRHCVTCSLLRRQELQVHPAVTQVWLARVFQVLPALWSDQSAVLAQCVAPAAGLPERSQLGGIRPISR